MKNDRRDRPIANYCRVWGHASDKIRLRNSNQLRTSWGNKNVRKMRTA